MAESRLTVVLVVAVLAGFCVVPGISTAAGRTEPSDVPPRISLSVPAELGDDAALVANGRVTPAPERGRVVLQFRKGERWRALGSVPLRRARFRIARPLPTTIEATRVRVLLFEGKRRVASSKVRAVRVRKSQPVPAPPSPTPPTPAEEPLSEGSLMATVEQYASLPNHLSGTANSAAALDQITSQLAAAGMQLGEQAFTYPGFLPTQVALSAGGASVPPAAIAPFLYSGTTPSDGITAPLFDGGDGVYDKSEVAGKIVVVSIGYLFNSKPVHLESAIEAAVEGGAVGLVAVTLGVGDYPKWQNSNARTGTGPLPVVMVGKQSGAAVVEAAEAGDSATLVLTANTATACDRDVWGVLEGFEPGRRMVVGVPASSFTPSATEHGTGVAILIGLARYYAAIPKSQRPATLVFMAVGGHEVGWLGLQTLIASAQGSWFTEADAYIHLGSGLGAPTMEEEPGGTIKTTPVPDPTGRLHNSENPLLENPIFEDFAAAGVPTPNVEPFVASGGEQTFAFAAGIPLVSFSGSTLFFHTAGDLPGTVDPAILAEDAEAFRRSVDTITALPPGQLRAENTLAAQHGTEINPAERAPNNPTLGAGGPLGTGGEGGPPAIPVAGCP